MTAHIWSCQLFPRAGENYAAPPMNYDFSLESKALQEPVSSETLERGLKKKKVTILLGFNPIPNPKSLRYVWMSFRKVSQLLNADPNHPSKRFGGWSVTPHAALCCPCAASLGAIEEGSVLSRISNQKPVKQTNRSPRGVQSATVKETGTGFQKPDGEFEACLNTPRYIMLQRVQTEHCR